MAGMARRELLTDDERRRIFGVPETEADIIRHYTLSPVDLELTTDRRGSHNRLGFAVQLCLLRHPGFGLRAGESVPEALLSYLAHQLGVMPAAFRDYSRRAQTRLDHAGEISAHLGLRAFTHADVPLTLDLAAAGAWSTDKGEPIARGLVEGLRAAKLILPSADTIERAGLAGRARARRRAAEALIATLTPEQLNRVDALLLNDAKLNSTPLAWLRDVPESPSTTNINGILERLAFVRSIGVTAGVADAVHEHRFRQFVREGAAAPAFLLSDYAASRRRATLVASLIDAETRLSDAAVEMTILEPTRVTVSDELKGKARRQAAGASLYQIMSDLMLRTTSTDRTVFAAVAAAARHHGLKRIAVQDPLSGTLSYKRLLVGASVLARKLSAFTMEGEAVGVLLPNANGAAATILGLMSGGRVPALINFTAGAINILAACEAAKVKTIVTSRGFIEKGRLDKLVGSLAPRLKLVYLEDVRAGVTLSQKLRAAINYTRPLATVSPDAPAVILFTSGSEGAPKGVVLSHRNILANAAQAAARIDFGRQDKVFNVLPVFHSFGLTVGLILPLVSGVPVFLYPSPLHYRIVPELIYGSNATILFGTDTFVAGYARVANPYDFRSLRYVLAGAEPVKVSTRNIYLEKFGLRILEGYGVTETAPVLAINTPMFNRFGTVGRLMPGMEARLEPIPGIEDGGRLYVRGPNIMLGYLRGEHPGQIEPPTGGWHDTGDIVAIDRDGFITIKGRAKRFAKIAGEMVSLAAIEALAAECWPDALSAVVAVPDPRKGERLVLVTQKAGAARAAFQSFAKSKGVADLMIPAELIVTKEMPLLGSGKLDFAGVKRLVEERMTVPSAA
jgi:acyl-CoA synthetase (AMP-forming)/AMP-acid ligase II